MNILNISNQSKQLLEILCKFGSLTTLQICNLLNLKQPTVNVKLRKLINKSLVKNQKNKWSKIMLYTITKKGLSLIEKSIFIANSFYWQNVEHNEAIIKVINKLNLNYSDYATDRDIRSIKKNKREHTPDLISKKEVNFQNFKINEKTPIEIELTFKSPKKRYYELFDFYNLKIYENEYKNVYYICSNKVYDKLINLHSSIKGNENIIFFKLENFLKY